MLTYAHEHFVEGAERLATKEFLGACSICRAPLRRASRCRPAAEASPCPSECDLLVCDGCGLMQAHSGTTCLQASLP